MSSKLQLNSEPNCDIGSLLAENKNVAVIPLAWPEMTARGQEKFWIYLKKLKILKNINFRIGHAAIVIAIDSQFLYYDFGRYITPMGYGRARSAETDPKLTLLLKPEWNGEGKLSNLEELCKELESIKNATHGSGPLFASINHEINAVALFQYIQSIINFGYIGYGCLSKSNTNCASFISKTLLAGWSSNLRLKKRFLLPITLTPTPYYNILAASEDSKFLIWENGKGSYFSNKLSHSLIDLLKKCYCSFTNKPIKELPSDEFPGQYLQPPLKPEKIKCDAVFLGGIGEAAWHSIQISGDNSIKMTRYYITGEFEFETEYIVEKDWIKKIINSSCKLTHDSHNCWVTFECELTGDKKRFLKKAS